MPSGTWTISEGEVTARQARVGRMPNSSPPPPEMLVASPTGVNGTGELLTITFEVLEFAEESLGLHNVQLSNSMNARISYYSVINPVVVTHQSPPEDVNRDGQVNILDLVAVAGSMGVSIGQANPINPRADVNNDGIINVLDLVAVYQHSSWGGSVTSTKGQRPECLCGSSTCCECQKYHSGSDSGMDRSRAHRERRFAHFQARYC